MPTPVVETPAPVETPASTLGEISDETPAAEQPAPVETPAPETQPAVEVQPTETVTPNPSEVGPTVPATPAPQTPEKKTLNTKLIAIAGGALVLVVAAIIGIVALTGSPKPTTNPASAPVISYGPDNSTPFAELDKEGALAYLNAVGKVDSYYPEEFIDETDSEILPGEGDDASKLLISYETKDQSKTIAFDSMDQAFRLKYAEKNLKTTEKVDYTVVYVDQETAECSECSRLVTFSNKIVNHFYYPAIDPATGAQVQNEAIIFTKTAEDSVKRYLPVVVYLTQDQIVYSSEYKSTDTEYQLVVNTIYLGLDEEKMATAEAGEVPRAINLATITYSVDKATGNFVIKSETSAYNQLKPVQSFAVTDEEVADLI